MNKIIFILTTLILPSSQLYSQVDEEFPPYRNAPFSLGFGLGFDYGGIGARATYIFANRVGIFGGLGYNFNQAGYNLGASVRFVPDKKVTPYIMLMYGYNAVINVSGVTEYRKTYYGTSLGGGIELKMKSQPNYFSFGILIPFRDPEFQDTLDALKAAGVEFSTEPLPFGISIGYHFGLR